MGMRHSDMATNKADVNNTICYGWSCHWWSPSTIFFCVYCSL